MLNLLAAMRLTSIKEIMISFEDVEESQVKTLKPEACKSSTINHQPSTISEVLPTA
jgi:hypothetical protein